MFNNHKTDRRTDGWTDIPTDRQQRPTLQHKYNIFTIFLFLWILRGNLEIYSLFSKEIKNYLKFCFKLKEI